MRIMPALPPLLALATACVSSAPLTDHGPDYWSPQELVCEDRVYSPTLGTVQFFKQGFELAPPVMELGSPDVLVLRFDDLQPNPEQLSYRIMHCDAHWQPSDLMTNQYINGSRTD